MSEENKPDPWASLASDLGVDVPAQQPQARHPDEGTDAAPKPRPAVKAKQASRAPAPQKSASEWYRLANDLGVDVPQEAIEPEPPAPAPPAKSWALEEECVLAEVVEEVTETNDSEGSEADVEISAERPEQSEQGEKKLRKRRKRRRKPRSSEDAGRGAEPSEASGQPIESSELAELVELAEESEDETVELIGSDSNTEASPEETERPRPKRRRRRRSGRKKSDSAGEQEGSTAASQGRSEEAAAESDDLDDLEDGDDESPEARGPRERRHEKLKAMHRGIPSWREAIDVVIATNMESRSKHPDRGGYSRPRGGRNRNGREKPSSEK